MTSDVITDPPTHAAPGSRMSRNRMALAGFVVYMLEWVAIIGASVQVPIDPASAGKLTDGYVGRTGALTFAAGWFALVLAGRIVFVAGVSQTLRSSTASARVPRWLTSTASAAMAVSVAIEVTTYAITAGIAAGATGTTADAARAIAIPNAIAWTLNLLVPVGFGISVTALAAAMWLSSCFPRALTLVGLAGGVLMWVTALLVVPHLAGPYAAVLGLGTLLSWSWMLWTGIVLWRVPRTAAADDGEDVRPASYRRPSALSRR